MICNLTPDKSQRIGVSGGSCTISCRQWGCCTELNGILVHLNESGGHRVRTRAKCSVHACTVKQVFSSHDLPGKKRFYYLENRDFLSILKAKFHFCNMNFSISHNPVTLLVFVKDVLDTVGAYSDRFEDETRIESEL